MNGLRKIFGIGLIVVAALVLALGCESPVQNYTRDQSRSVVSQDILNILSFDVVTNGTKGLCRGRR